MKVKSEREVAQSSLILSDPMDHSLPGSSIHGIFQARVLEWGAIAFSITLFIIPKTQKQPKYPSTHEWIKKMWFVCIYTFKYIYACIHIHRKEWNWVICGDIDGTRDEHTEWSESERERQISNINMYIGEGNGTPLLPGKFHGQKSLVGCSPWGR